MADGEHKSTVAPLLIAVFIGAFIVSSMTMYVIISRVLEHRYASKNATGGEPVTETAGVTVSASSVARTTTALMQAPPDELTKRTLSFLLHQYQKQKVTIRDQAVRMEALDADNRKLASQVAALSQQIAALQPKNESVMSVPDEPQPSAAVTETAVEDNSKQLKRVAELYNKMKPEEAQRIVSSIDDEELLKLFSKMKPNAVARILALIDAGRAARLSERMMQ